MLSQGKAGLSRLVSRFVFIWLFLYISFETMIHLFKIFLSKFLVKYNCSIFFHKFVVAVSPFPNLSIQLLHPVITCWTLYLWRMAGGGEGRDACSSSLSSLLNALQDLSIRSNSAWSNMSTFITCTFKVLLKIKYQQGNSSPCRLY